MVSVPTGQRRRGADARSATPTALPSCNRKSLTPFEVKPTVPVGCGGPAGPTVAVMVDLLSGGRRIRRTGHRGCAARMNDLHHRVRSAARQQSASPDRPPSSCRCPRPVLCNSTRPRRNCQARPTQCWLPLLLKITVPCGSRTVLRRHRRRHGDALALVRRIGRAWSERWWWERAESSTERRCQGCRFLR